MSTTQATLSDLDRRADSDPDSARIVLSGRCSDTVFDPIEITFGDFIHERSGKYSDDLDGFEAAKDRARDIINRGSPAVYTARGVPVDKYVFCFGGGSEAVADVLEIDNRDGIASRQIIVPDPASLGKSAPEIAEVLAPLAGCGCEVVLKVGGEWVSTQGESRLRTILTGVIAAREWGIQLKRRAEKQDIKRWCDWDMDGGRAPLGFTWVDGELVPANDYDEVCATLELAQSGRISKNKAAAHLDTSPRTIRRSIEERGERYGLQ